MSETKIITHDTYMKALALFTLANDHAVQSTEYADGLCSLLGYSDRYAGHVSDEIYSGGRRASVATFRTALEKEGFKISAQEMETSRSRRDAFARLVEQGVMSADDAALLQGKTTLSRKKKRRNS